MVKSLLDTKEVPEKTTENQAEARQERKKSPRGQHPMPAILRVPCALLFLMIISIFLTWFVIYRTNSCDAEAALDFIRSNLTITAYNYLVIFALLTIITTITWRPFLSTGLFFCVISVITFIHIQKYRLRAEPLLPEEFQLADTAGDLIKFVEITDIYKLVGGAVLVLLGSFLVEYYVRKFVGRDHKVMPWWEKSAIVPRVTFTMSGLALLAAITSPIIQRKDYDWTEAELLAWNQADNYNANGFVIGFLYNMGKVTIPAPSNYTETKMQQIAEKYRELKLADTTRDEWEEVAENVIVILAETFYDPALLTEHYAHTGGDVTPNLHKIFQKYPSGYMYSPEYGGGTANVEFEVQTGLSNFWVQSYPYVNLVSKLDHLYSIADFAQNMNYATTAVHSYTGAMYKRRAVYPVLGYGTFIEEEDMRYTDREYNSNVLNDKAIYSEILDILEDNDGSQMIGAVTMQNHSPYTQAEYPKVDFTIIDRTDLSDSQAWEIESNFQSLHTSDQYLADFLEALDDLDERTVVLWYGDHAMGMLDRYKNSDSKSDRDTARFTPYFIYANFDVESPYSTREVARMNAEQGFAFNNIRGVNLPTTTPNCLQNTFYDVLNIQKPALFYLVDQVCQDTPVLSPVYYAGKSPKPSEVLNDYELVNYDLLIGKQYWDGY